MRDCGDCTACCEGALHGEVKGITFYAGKPCHFCNIGSGCSDYQNRPQMCIDFKCEWLKNEDIPIWLKPSLSKVIIVKQKINDIEFIQILETEKKIDSSVLSWLFVWARNSNQNISWQCNGGNNWVGSYEFCEAMNNRK